MSDDPHRIKSSSSNRNVWWFEDSRGRRIGYVWPEDALAILDSIWGRRKGIAGFARYAGLNRATVERYCNGTNPIPKDVAALLMCIQHIAVNDKDHTKFRWRVLPKFEADWLPNEESSELRLTPFD